MSQCKGDQKPLSRKEHLGPPLPVSPNFLMTDNRMLPPSTQNNVVLDTCVLLPMPLADTLWRLAEVGLFRPKWSPTIMDEMCRNLTSEKKFWKNSQ